MTQLLSAEYRQLNALGAEFATLDGGYTRADVSVALQGSSTRAGMMLRVPVTEDTKLYHPFSPAEIAAGAPEAEEYSLNHLFTFTLENDGAWRMSGDRAYTGSMPPTTYMAEPQLNLEVPGDDSGAPDEVEEPKEPPSSTGSSPGPAPGPKAVRAVPGYDYGKMAAYADRYWKNYNGAYRSYGNDCTNFISQAMKAGGWSETSGSAFSRKSNKRWFYGSLKLTTSYTWAGAENWYWFASKYSNRTRILPYVTDMGRADVLQADFDRNNNIDHTMIVTKRYADIPYLTYHTSSVHNRSWKKIRSKYPRAWWYAHRT